MGFQPGIHRAALHPLNQEEKMGFQPIWGHLPSKAIHRAALHPLNQEEKMGFQPIWGHLPRTVPFGSFLQPPGLPPCCSPGSIALQADTARGKRQISVLQ